MMILWVALTASIAVYAALAGMIAASAEASQIPVPSAGQNSLKAILSVLAVVNGALALFIFFGPRKRAKNYSGLLKHTVVAYVLSESVALFGLVLSITMRQPELIYPYCGGALLLNLAMFPGRSGSAPPMA